ncbi:hypothetical protein PQX77_011549 [Marasmius sp. AFHP31]|nr:hypothetical protein PQX77_011549 [Marasmius sp. AFHP31]
MSRSPNLPTEIWLSIAVSLSRHDAVQLCNTNSRLLSILRPNIYRRVSLWQQLPPDSIDATLSLLGLPALGFDVSPDDLEVYMRPRKKSSLINLDAMKNMTRLRSLELGGRVFGSVPNSLVAGEEEYADSDMKAIGHLCELVRGKIPQGLEELAVQNPSTWAEGDTGIGVSSDFYARLEGLKVIKWEGTNGPIVQEGGLRNMGNLVQHRESSVMSARHARFKMPFL